MPRRRRWRPSQLVCVAALFVGACCAALPIAIWWAVERSQHSPQAPRIEADKQTNNSTSSAANPEQQPKRSDYPIAIPPAPPSSHLNEEASGDSHHGNEQGSEYWPWVIYGFKLKVTDSLLALFTLCLVVIGAWQGAHLKRTVDSFLAGERPYLMVEPGKTYLLPDNPIHDAVAIRPKIDFTYTNFGRTPAIATTRSDDVLLASELPAKPIYSAPIRGLMPVSADKPQQLDRSRATNLTLDECKAAREGKKTFFLFGYVIYEDVFDTEHTLGFAFSFDLPKRIFTPVANKAYSYRYTKKRRPASRVWPWIQWPKATPIKTADPP